jgi:hypothetical protein
MTERMCRYCDDPECMRLWHMYRQALRQEVTTKQGRREWATEWLAFGVAAYFLSGWLPFWWWFPTLLILMFWHGVNSASQQQGGP